MSKKLTYLQFTLQQTDIIDLGTCYSLYRICNGNQFESAPGTDFANFLNLKECATPIIAKSREKLRICYMIYVLSGQIQNSEMAKEWRSRILGSCGISYSYYKSHYKDAEDLGASRECKSFVEEIKYVVFKR